MSDNSTEQEPSIEEILASIRQIISDDDEEETKDDDAIESPVHDDGDDVLELTEDDLEENVEIKPEADPEPEVESKPEIFPEEEPVELEMRDRPEEIQEEEPAMVEEPEITPEPAPARKETIPSDILSSVTQAAAIGSLSKLATKMPVERSRSFDGVTLEDIVRELLHPMLREWMDDNLPPMVERIVQKELEKLARRAMDD